MTAAPGPGAGFDAPDPIERAGAAAAAGHGPVDAATVAALARLAGADPDGRVRQAAVGALARLAAGSAEPEARAAVVSAVRGAVVDADPGVRRRAAEAAVTLGPGSGLAGDVLSLLADDDPLVAEAGAFALGELDEEAVAAGAVEALDGAARRHGDILVREASVAALGSLGLPAGLGAVLAALDDRPPVRRRAVIALAAFEGDEVEDALRRALEDRDWQVRQAAEDLLAPGRG